MCEDETLSRNLLRAAFLVGQMTLFSRVLGLVRDGVIAAIFGTSHATDAFFVAFRIPNFLRRLFAEGAFSQAFIPVLASYKAERTAEDIRSLLDAVTTALATLLLVITAFGVVAAPLLVMVFAPGFVHDADSFALSSELLRFTFPYLFFISLTAVLGGILNTYGRFAVPAFTPVLLNVAMISSALWLAPELERPIVALAIGVAIGGVLQVGLQIYAVQRIGLLPRFNWNWRHPGVQRILVLIGPAIFGVSVAQINFLIDTAVASYLPRGSVSWLYFSDRLMEFPLGIFGIALGTVILPSLSEYHARGQHQVFSDTLDWGMRLIFVVTIPSAVGLIVLAGPILSTLFQYGKMTEWDVVQSAKSLIAYAFGLSGFVCVKVLAPGFYARQDIRTPVKIGLAAVGCNLIFIFALKGPLQHAGLALATSLAAFVNAGLLFLVLYRDRVYRPRPGWLTFVARIFIAAGIMAAVLLGLRSPMALWSEWTPLLRALRLTGLLGLGILVYFGSCWALGLRLRHIVQPKSAI